MAKEKESKAKYFVNRKNLNHDNKSYSFGDEFPHAPSEQMLEGKVVLSEAAWKAAQEKQEKEQKPKK